MEAATIPAYVRVLSWLKGMPDWFKATVLGGVVAVATILAIGWASSADASEVADLKTRVAAVEAEQKHDKNALERIEGKLDRLILELIGKK